MKVLINRTDAIGDTILTTPMAQRIKEKFPDAHIIFLVDPKVLDIFKNHPYIDEVWLYDRKESFLKRNLSLWKKFKTISLDYYFYVGGSHWPTLISRLKRIKFRGGLKSRWQTFLLLNFGVRQKRSRVDMHEVDYNLSLLGPLGIEHKIEDGKNYRPVISLDNNEVNKALKLFKEEVIKSSVLWKDEIIIIHPGMSGHTLNWSTENYAKLISRIEQKFPDRFLFVISYTASDGAYLKELKTYLNLEENNNLQNKIFYFDGVKKGLRNYMKILSRAKIFVGPSTGPTHIANTLGVNVAAIYSPIKVQSAYRWGPYAKHDSKTAIVVPDVVCEEHSKCLGESCPHYECMSKIEVEEVLNFIYKKTEN